MVLPATVDPNGPLDDTVGALYIGTLFSSILYGVIVLQAFHYSYTEYSVSRSKLLCTLFLFLVFCQVGVGISWVIISWQKKTYVDLAPFLPLAITCSVLTCSIDMLISVGLCLLLHRARTGFKRSDTMIDRLILFVISTGSLTTIFAIAVVINMLALPYTLVFAGFHFCIGRLYTNSFLATLNARSTIGEDIELTPSSMSHRGSRVTTASKPRNINILIETTQEMGVETIRDSIATKGHIENFDDPLPKSVGSL